ncbi:MAG TPA: methionyl-tRNA formyltransferase [Synergistales bacterium]|nr:methionyl-tRNA formyltransferase [Synergistales bacterium]
MNVWFFGSGHFAALCFREIAPHLRFEKVVTLPPSPAGRGRALRPTPLEEQARSLGFSPIHSSQPSADPVLREDILANPPDLALIVDFSRFIREPLLNGPRMGCLNIHPSLLPAYRGAAPIQRALMDGATQTGVTLFRLVEKMDAGPILLQKAVPVGLETTAGELSEILAREGSQIFLKSLEYLRGGYAEYIAQDESAATFAPKISKTEERLAWSDPAPVVHNRVRALNPSPGVHCFFSGKRLKIWKTRSIDGPCANPGRITGFEQGFPVVACSSGGVVLLEVQPEGRGILRGDEWARGSRIKEGDQFE